MKRALLGTSAVVLIAVGTLGCDVDVKDKGQLPDVDVAVEPGRVPDVDVRGPDVDVKTKETTIKVPDVDIKTKKKTIKVPDVDVRIPQENDNEEKPADTDA